MSPGSLSKRGQRLIDSPPLSEYLYEHFARLDAPYDRVTRPDGYIALCVAENKLVSDLLLPELGRERALPPSVLGYDRMTGSLAFREKLAQFLGRRVLGRSVRAEQIAVLAGAGSALELLFHVIADPGDGVLVPTPSYAGFWPDLETRDALRIVPVPGRSENAFRLSLESLDRAFESAPCPIKALLFTSPDNPMGRVYAADEIARIVDWTEAHRIHLVMDEIYALSVFGDRPFVSVAVTRGELGQRVHIVWAFSKDFGASGLRAGVLVSENEAVLAAIDALAYWSCCSGHTQHVLGEMISDERWLNSFLAVSRTRLADAYRAVTSALQERSIAFVPSDAGFFLLLDLRRSLGTSSFDAEHALWQRLLRETNVNLTPGNACRIAEPGFMRLCFAAVPADVALVAVDKIGRALGAG